MVQVIAASNVSNAGIKENIKTRYGVPDDIENIEIRVD